MVSAGTRVLLRGAAFWIERRKSWILRSLTIASVVALALAGPDRERNRKFEAIRSSCGNFPELLIRPNAICAAGNYSLYE